MLNAARPTGPRRPVAPPREPAILADAPPPDERKDTPAIAAPPDETDEAAPAGLEPELEGAVRALVIEIVTGMLGDFQNTLFANLRRAGALGRTARPDKPDKPDAAEVLRLRDEIERLRAEHEVEKRELIAEVARQTRALLTEERKADGSHR